VGAVENSYLDIFYDQGMIGLIFWGLFLSYILLIGINKLRADPEILPWIFAWIVILLSMVYVTMEYDPLTWVVAGIIVGWTPVSTKCPCCSKTINNMFDIRLPVK